MATTTRGSDSRDSGFRRCQWDSSAAMRWQSFIVHAGIEWQPVGQLEVGLARHFDMDIGDIGQ